MKNFVFKFSDRVKSVGYDMLKQRGGWQATGKTPFDMSLEFNNFFDHEVEDFSKSLMQSESMEEDKARQQACNNFQVSLDIEFCNFHFKIYCYCSYSYFTNFILYLSQLITIIKVSILCSGK